MAPHASTFQSLILSLQRYWAEHGCVILQPYDMEMGAGTFHPATTLRALGPEPWRCAYVQPSRRPTDGRYGENPNRLQHYYQFQVILKPSPAGHPGALPRKPARTSASIRCAHDIRFVEDDWESPTLGAWGLGWEVWCDGMEVTQFTYFQQVGGIECRAGVGRADLRARAAGDVRAGRRERLRPRLGRLRHDLRRRLSAGRAGRSRPTISSMPTPSCCSATSPMPRPSARRCWRSTRRWRCPPTTSASRRATVQSAGRARRHQRDRARRLHRPRARARQAAAARPGSRAATQAATGCRA